MHKALIVEDTAVDRMTCTRLLERLGIESVEVNSGAAALKELEQREDVTFVLLDWSMPLMDGVEVAEIIRSKPKLHNLKLIMLTGKVEMRDVEGALGASVDEYIMKPVTSDILLEKLALLNIYVRE